TSWTSYGANGKSSGGDRVFDTARNWEVAAGILKNPYFGKIRSILISDPLKANLLAYANLQLRNLSPMQSAERAELEFLIQEAKKLMRQPTSSPHDNHFHLSLSL
ncbi:hypothetical protein N9B94_04500, partial [Verrucomicrobia bacterium]|nr:hypothetical protein [Verrucomicrobiota bacterium]